MKRWQWMAIIVALLAVVWYFFFYRGSFRTGMSHSSAPTRNNNPELADFQPPQITWETTNRADEGFKLEMPANPRELEVPAYNEKGSSEPVHMLFSTPGGATTFAVTWEDNPPVVRVNDHVADRTLNQARDGMLARTQTSLVAQSSPNVAGFPALDLNARNSQGGILDARLILVYDRLYTLIAAFPSSGARREQDVTRFYNSFTPMLAGFPITARGGRGNS